MLHAHRLRLSAMEEDLDLRAPDCFLPEVDSCWKPTETIHDAEELMTKLLGNTT